MTDILNNDTGIPNRDPNKNIREKAYDLVDIALNCLSQKDGEWLLGIFDIYTTEGQIAKDILINNDFITLRGNNIDDTTVDITERGLTILEMGGYKVYLSANDKLVNKSIEKENLEIQQLRANVQLLTNQLSDYEKTKSRVARNELIQWISTAILLIGLIVSLLSKKSG